MRPMAIGDLEEALKIEKASFPNPWSYGQFESELKNPVSNALVASAPFEGSEVLAGYIIYWTVHGEAHILNIAVNPLLRRRGIAAFLLRESLARMRRTLVFEVFLEVRKSNAAARALYRRFGFREAYERKNYYGDEDAIVMTLVF
ncbi:MAG: ribosomal-protein-alanine N-acetyltransferase [Deltaproteobacteria bacterium GWB2_55_19]|nr:MAG: ribosomal-protein-alanine N-acetyltransferase [Deltaproteobacteria bacterium GWB2_55_19]